MRIFKKGIIISLILIFILQAFAPICLATDDADEYFSDSASTQQAAKDTGAGTSKTTSTSSTATSTEKSTTNPGADLANDRTVIDEEELGTSKQVENAMKAGATETTLLDSATTWGSMILYYPLQLVIGLVTGVLETIANVVSGQKNTTPESVLFNKVGLVDINFFDLDGSSNTFVKGVRSGVAGWYYGIRNIAIIASLCVLIYIAIRMAITSAADEKGKYKEMLKNWLVSFILIFVLHYIMMLVLYGNSQLVKIFSDATKVGDGTSQTSDLDAYMTKIKANRYSIEENVSTLNKFGSNIICLLMAGITIGFLFMYIKRFIVIAFLIVIAPLITITYAIDKIRRWKVAGSEYMV